MILVALDIGTLLKLSQAAHEENVYEICKKYLRRYPKPRALLLFQHLSLCMYIFPKKNCIPGY